MKIAIFIPSMRGGGVEKVMVNLSRGMYESGNEVDLVLTKAEGPNLVDVSSGVNIINLNSSRVLVSLIGLVRYLKRKNPEVILSAMSHVNIVAIWAVSIAKTSTRVIVSEHTTISHAAKNSKSIRSDITLLLMRWLYPKVTKIIVVSEFSKKDLVKKLRLDPALVRVIYNPVVTTDVYSKAKLDVIHPWLKSKIHPVVIAVGRLSRSKNFDGLLKAFSLVLKKCDARLIIVGEGSERKKLEKIVRDLNLTDQVDLPGYVENPYAYLSRATVFVLSSLYEGLPTALIEALAIGVPVVSTDCPSGPREILKGGQYGCLVPINDVKSMANSIVEVLSSEKTIIVPRKAIEQFSLSVAVENYLQLFQEK